MELNRGQRLGLNIDAHIVLDAGAGTGKTHCIVQRTLEHYLSEDQRATRLLPPGPRDIDLSGGLLAAPTGEREDLREWRALLPTEVVVLTFTVRAAEELRDRMRRELGRLRPGPRGERDGLRYDPRIRREGLVEQLGMLLDEAPIGTIDSFLSRLVTAHRNQLGERPTHDQVSDAQRVLLLDRALNSCWRIQNERHAGDVKVHSVTARAFIDARNRISSQLGGRSNAQGIIAKLLRNGVFVTSCRRALRERGASGSIDAQSLRSAFTEMLDDAEVTAFCADLHLICDEWVDACRERAADFDLVTALGAQTRYRCVDELVSTGPPGDTWGKLLWLHHLLTAICSISGRENLYPSVFPGRRLPNGDGWPSGLPTLASIRDASAKAATTARLGAAMNDARRLFATLLGQRMRSCAIIAYLFDGTSEPPHLPADATVSPVRLTDPIPAYEARSPTALTVDVDARLLEDLLLVHAGAHDVLTELKLAAGMHDHDDVASLAEDLLLSRCPSVCRRWYPPEVVERLDALDLEHPWTDSHLDAAMALVESAFEVIAEDGVERRVISDAFRDWPMREVADDLTRRIHTLKTIRRRFRAFIIDEAQDNSIQQWLLLSRLWGVRQRVEGDPDPPQSAWQPTVCWVGDQKQSIYGFRQAQVSGMARYTTHLRSVNEYEFANEERLLLAPALRKRAASRDPRLVDTSSFVTALEWVNSRPIPANAWIRFDLDDDGNPVSAVDTARRAQGHIDLVTNYRTCQDLLETMNEWWEDLFAPRHDLFPGDWYARARALRAHRTEERGGLEWLLPLSGGAGSDPPEDLAVAIDPFDLGEGATAVHLENELIASRIRALVDGSAMRVHDPNADDGWLELPAAEAVEPRDIMVLMPSRTHMADLVHRLTALGVPALADQEGGLLEQPVVQALMALVQMVARPRMPFNAAALSRSPLIGHSDVQLQEFLLEEDGDEDLLVRLVEHAVSDGQRALVQRWVELANSGRLLRLLSETLDHSDLLLAHPTPVERQYAEQFVELVSQQIAEAGGDVVLLADRMHRLSQVAGRHLPSTALPPGNAVQLMTIHGAKGLQSKVVIVTGMFSENQSNISQSLKDRLLITADMFSPRTHPWRSRPPPDSGSWRLSNRLLEAQVQAEARRLLYVACTRAKDLLILAGAPRNAALAPAAASIEIDWKYGPTPHFGQMWLEALRQSSSRAGDAASPWLLDGDEAVAYPLPHSFSGDIALSPAALVADAHLPPNGLTSFPILHHPDCVLEEREVVAPLVTMQRLHDSARLDPEPTPAEQPRNLTRRIRMAPHRLDTASRCIRQHWLSTHIGLLSEPIRLPLLEDDGGGEGEREEGPRLPEPTVLGSLFHRLVELGIGNPGPPESGPLVPLPAQWMRPNADMRTSLALIDTVGDELLPVDVDRAATSDLLLEMGRTLQQGPLGRLCAGEVVGDDRLEGLRTEWPFTLQVPVELADCQEFAWTPTGEVHTATVDRVLFDFNGLADLVLCTQRGEGERATIRAVDLKTESCLGLLDETTGDAADVAGTLFEPVADPDEPTSRNEAESALLGKYRFQLQLYHQALLGLERMRQRAGLESRDVLPPVILVGATGRMITWTDAEWEEVASEFSDHLEMLARVSVTDHLQEANFPRLPEEQQETCHRCPFFLGDVRICAPEGWPLHR